jgi:hypothetical protein
MMSDSGDSFKAQKKRFGYEIFLFGVSRIAADKLHVGNTIETRNGFSVSFSMDRSLL